MIKISQNLRKIKEGRNLAGNFRNVFVFRHPNEGGQPKNPILGKKIERVKKKKGVLAKHGGRGAERSGQSRGKPALVKTELSEFGEKKARFGKKRFPLPRDRKGWGTQPTDPRNKGKDKIGSQGWKKWVVHQAADPHAGQGGRKKKKKIQNQRPTQKGKNCPSRREMGGLG